MSGGGSSRDSGGWGGGADRHTPCDELTFQTRLQSVRAEIVSTIDKGDVLTVDLTDEPSIVAVAPTGIVGSITDRVVELLACLNQGSEFHAVVDVIDGGNVEVTVRPA